MDIDIIRDQKLGAGAGTRSNKVRLFVCVGAEQIALGGQHCSSVGGKINSRPLHYP